MEKRTEYYETDKRMYPRESASGIVTVKAYEGDSRYYASYYKDFAEYYKDAASYKNLYGNAEMLDKSYGGIRIKTPVPLAKGYMLEVDNSETQIAMVRWAEKAEDYYYAGLMFAH